jgi:hypothetical protein
MSDAQQPVGQRQVNSGNLAGSVNVPPPEANPSVSTDQLAEIAATAELRAAAQQAIDATRPDNQIGVAP